MRRCELAAHRGEIGPMLVRMGLTGLGVEVGVQRGAFSELLLERWPGVLHLVDPWRDVPGYRHPEGRGNLLNLHLATKAVRRFGTRAVFHRETSRDALARVPDGLDFVYLDGDHRHSEVTADLWGWWPKLRPGGLMMGHDVFYLPQMEVTQAVVEFAWLTGVEVQIIMGSPNNEARDGQVPSFMMVKPGSVK